MRLLNKLSFRLSAPIVLLAVFMWGGLYFFVSDVVRSFSRDLADQQLTSISREILNTCNASFDEVVKAGLMNDPREVRVRKAMTLVELEDLFEEFNVHGIVYKGEDPHQEALVHTEGLDRALLETAATDDSHRLFTLNYDNTGFFAYSFDFQPWQWHIVLLRETASFQALVEKIRRFYWITGMLLLGMALVLIFLENRYLREPVRRIIRDLRRSEPPQYRGIEDFEFLSDSIAEMMQTLADREARLRESQIRYRTIFETTGTSIVICEEDTTISMVNSQFLEDTGYSREEVEGKLSWMEIVSERDRERAKLISEQRKKNPAEAPRQYELVMVGKFGDEKHVLLTVDFIPGTRQTLASLMDITDRKKEELERRLEQEARAAEALRRKNLELGREIEERKRIEDSLRASEERFKAIFQTAEDSIFIKNTDLVYSHVNTAFARLLERPVSEIIGQRDEDLSLDVDFIEHSRLLETRVLAGETFETEHTLTWKGWPISLTLHRFPLRDSSGRAFGVCGIARDISDRRAARNTQLMVPAQAYHSPAMQEILEQVILAAQSDSTVLFLGESGSGKDHWAKFLHDHSNRSGGSFIAINCAALAPDLVESELFGHESGSFTGAHRRKRGLLELAEGGTLLLNEIGEMPLPIQAKFLSFLDTQKLMRVGGQASVSVNTRILAATNHDLTKEISLGRFRADLYYRLAVFTIQTPPLKDRREDLPILAGEILSGLTQKMGLGQVPSMDAEALELLVSYHWPGNVRELRNVLERALILWRGDRIVAEDLGLKKPGRVRNSALHGTKLESLLLQGACFHEAVNETKRFLISNALTRSRGNIKDAAEALGMNRNAIDYQIRTLGLRKEGDSSSP